jgi:hypothetical protein
MEHVVLDCSSRGLMRSVYFMSLFDLCLTLVPRPSKEWGIRREVLRGLRAIELILTLRE